MGNNEFRDNLLTVGGAGTTLAGTILARKAVDDAIVAAADGGNTGDGTVTAASVVTGPVVPLVGAYNLEVVEAVANGGIWKLEDPNGALVAEKLTMTVGAGAATVFEIAGMTFTITDAGTDFALADKFSLTVAANGKMVVFALAGLGGAQFPIAVLTSDEVATGAGDLPIRPAISGQVRKEKLIIDLDGDGSNVDVTVLDQLRDFGIIPIDVQELNVLDNQ
jgi:hypothetical protein